MPPEEIWYFPASAGPWRLAVHACLCWLDTGHQSPVVCFRLQSSRHAPCGAQGPSLAMQRLSRWYLWIQKASWVASLLALWPFDLTSQHQLRSHEALWLTVLKAHAETGEKAVMFSASEAFATASLLSLCFSCTFILYWCKFNYIAYIACYFIIVLSCLYVSEIGAVAFLARALLKNRFCNLSGTHLVK